MYLAGKAKDYMVIDSECSKMDFDCMLSNVRDYLDDFYSSYQDHFKEDVSNWDIIAGKPISEEKGMVTLSVSPSNEDLKNVASWLVGGFSMCGDMETREMFVNRTIAFIRQELVMSLDWAYLKKRPIPDLYVTRWHNLEVYLREAVIENNLLNLETCSNDWIAFEEMEELSKIWEIPEEPPNTDFLPKELQTEDALLYFKKAVDKGFVHFSCGNYIWKGNKQKLACFAKEMSDKLHLSNTMNGDGTYRTNWQLFEKLFGVDKLRFSMADMKKIRHNPHYDDIDEIFK